MRPTGREGGEQLACRGASRRDARIEDEPAPWKRGRSAKAPMSATSPPALSGSTPPSFFRRTAPSRATRRAAAWFCESSSSSAAPSSARPRRLCCAASTSAVTRVAVNALIAFAALFAKNKVIARVAFSSVAELARKFGAGNLPEIHGGEARAPTEAWIEERLRAFPRMDLPAYGQA